MKLDIKKKSTNFLSSYMFLSSLFFCTFIPNPIFSDPWGKDADLSCRRSRPTSSQQCIACPRSSILTEIGDGLIVFHQQVISPADGPRSHFIPSSSQYTRDAMREYGFFQGFIMGCDRLMRENSDPWVYRTISDSSGKVMKWDPVP